MFENIFGEKFLRNPNLIDVELLSTEIKVIKTLVEDYIEHHATGDEKLFLFYPILAKLEDAISEENKQKSYEKSLIKNESEAKKMKKFTVKNRVNGKIYYEFNNRQDAENAILHLEDMYGIDYTYIEIIESEVEQ